MDVADLTEFVDFEEGEALRRTVFESERLWVQTLCLDRNGSYGPASDRGSDAVVTVLAGEAVFLVNKKRKRLKQWGSILIAATDELVVSNASTEPLVLLMVVAPPPPAGGSTG